MWNIEKKSQWNASNLIQQLSFRWLNPFLIRFVFVVFNFRKLHSSSFILSLFRKVLDCFHIVLIRYLFLLAFCKRNMSLHDIIIMFIFFLVCNHWPVDILSAIWTFPFVFARVCLESAIITNGIVLKKTSAVKAMNFQTFVLLKLAITTPFAEMFEKKTTLVALNAK